MTERAQALEAALIGAGVLAQEVLASRQNVGNYLRQLAQSVLNDLSTTENIPQPIQRFDLVSVSFAYTSDHEMQRSDDGEWVRFDDVFPPAALSPVEPTVHNDLCSWCLTQADHVAASEECYERNSERGRITTRPPVEPTPEPLTDAERLELQGVEALVMLPTFTARERDIALTVYRAVKSPPTAVEPTPEPETCASECNPYMSRCGAKFCTFEDMAAHEQECKRLVPSEETPR